MKALGFMAVPWSTAVSILPPSPEADGRVMIFVLWGTRKYTSQDNIEILSVTKQRLDRFGQIGCG